MKQNSVFRVIQFAILGVIILATILILWSPVAVDLPSKGTSKKTPSRQNAPARTPLTADEKTKLHTWFRHDSSLQGAKEIGGICLRHRLTINEVEELVGEPTYRDKSSGIGYGFAPSQLLDFRFGEDGTMASAWIGGEAITLDKDIH